MNIHRRQFILGPDPINTIPGWVQAVIPDIGYLCHCPELPTTSVQDADGYNWILLGSPIQTDANRPDPEIEISSATSHTIQDLYQGWAGRWLLIGRGKLHMDSSGLLGCFYSARQNAAGKSELWVSSSAALLSEVLGFENKLMRSISHRVGIDWYPPPGSCMREIRRLLPSQILELDGGYLIPRRLIPEISQNLSYEEILDRLQSYLVTTLRNAVRNRDRIWLPLTAGYDSRLLLAAARCAGISVRTCTHSLPYMSVADRTLPPKLAEAAGFSHSMFYGKGHRKDLAALFEKHTGGMSADRDSYYISREYFNYIQKGDLILGGGCFEIGRCYYWSKFSGSGIIPNVPGVDIILNVLKEGSNPVLIQALNEWIDWTRRTPHQELDWRDRFYLEQRLSGWLSSMEQSLDLIDADRLYIANSHYYFAHVFRIPEEKRRVSQHHIDLIARMAPELMEFPFNPVGPILQRISRRILITADYFQSRLGL
ncbi:MAG TPA: hypothetical protein VN316_02680 [candidate division Zixibacteria bacterium]|nr:hypothetical protein [candidate division Zixibacteria bacterium]